MTPTLTKRPAPRFLTAVSLSVMLGVAFGLSPAIAWAAGSLQFKNRLIDLMLCYAEGTDTFGEPGNPDAFEEGLATYEECFTEDAVFKLWPAGTDFDDEPLVTIVGPAAWAANIVDPAVPRDPTTGLSVSRGQHMLSNFKVESRAQKARLTAYLSATRTTFDPNPDNPVTGVVTKVSVANGSYTLHIVRVKGKWLIGQLDLKLISLADYFSAN